METGRLAQQFLQFLQTSARGGAPAKCLCTPLTHPSLYVCIHCDEEQEAQRRGELTKPSSEHACIRGLTSGLSTVQALDHLRVESYTATFLLGACLRSVSLSLPQSAGSRLARLVGPKLHTAHKGSQHLTVLQVTRVASGQHVALGFLIKQPQDLLVMDLQSSGVKMTQRSFKRDCGGVWG